MIEAQYSFQTVKQCLIDDDYESNICFNDGACDGVFRRF